MNELARRRADKERERLILQAQRKRHLREVAEQDRRDREARAAKKAKKATRRAEQRAIDLKRRQAKLARRGARA